MRGGEIPLLFKVRHMDTLEFFRRVLPQDGFYVSACLTSEGMRQGFVKTLEELAAVCLRLDKTGNNTYYAVSSYKEKGKRKQDNVYATKLVALDIDVGKYGDEGELKNSYASAKDALVAVGKFIADTSMPKPMIVFSGAGLHVYWVLDRALAPDLWLPLAQAIKKLAVAHGLIIDPAVPADSARILRPIGTTNPKTGKTVRLLIDAPDVDTDALINMVGVVAAPPVKSNYNLINNLTVDRNFPPAVASTLVDKCQQIKWAVNNQAEVSEPLWYALLGIAAHCEDPENTAIEWSRQHNGYSQEATLSKLAQWKRVTTGPTTCSKIEAERPDGCKGCRYKDKIGTPTRLGFKYQEVQSAAPDEISNQVVIPKPYKRTAHGIKCTIDGTDIDVCNFDIYPVSYGRDESLGYETVRYNWHRAHVGWQRLTFRQAYLTEGHREFPTALADQGIVLPNKKTMEIFQHMLRSYMDELRKVRTMTNLYSSMGWKEGFTQFLIGDTLLRLDENGYAAEEEVNLAVASQRSGSEMFGVDGTLAAAVQGTAIIERFNMPQHGFAYLYSLSSVLYAFTGLKGVVLSLYGPTGGGKTLAQLWGQSIYGNPDKLHFAAKYTQNSLFARMASYCHMPLSIDEATMMQDKDVGDFVYWVSQGRDKARLNRNAEERDAKTWALNVSVSTNRSLQSKMVSTGLETDAQMARMLEVTVPQHDLFVKDSSVGRRIYNHVNANYGHVGREFLKKLLEIGEAGVKSLIAEATDKFSFRYNSEFSGEERFWEQAIILADLAGRLATEWNLIAFDFRKPTLWVLEEVGAIRKSIQDNKLDAFDLLAEYFNDCAQTAVTVFHTMGQKPVADHSRMPRADIRIRFDVHRKAPGVQFDKGVVMMDRAHLRKWLSLHGADYRAVLNEITDENALATPRSQKYYLGKDTPVKTGQTYVVGVNLSHPRLQGILNEADTAVENITLGTLQVV